MTADPRNFLLNTDYPLDKIIYIKSGSFSAPDGASTLTIVHGLPFTPLPILLWSNTSDFTICNESSDADNMESSFGSPAGQVYDIFGGETELGISCYNYTGSSKTVYYRIFCFMPSDEDEDSVVPSTEVSGSNFVINTDYNYMKLVYSGKLTNGGVESFRHNLGYVPRALIWSGASGTTYRMPYSQIIESDPDGSTGDSTGVYIDSNNIVWMNPTENDTIHYRIYYDA